jgi:ketosteroid isomerase-like protein
MNHLRSVLLGCVVAVIAAVAVVAPQADAKDTKPTALQAKAAATESANIAAIRAISGKWKALYAAARYSEIPELYTVDTLVMPRGRPVISGREQMRKAIGGLAAGRRVEIDLTEREIVISGKYAWVVSDFKVTYSTPNSSAPPTSELGRGLVVFRHDADGQWRIHRDMDSPAPHAPVVAAALTPAKPKRAVPAMWNPSSRTEVTACDRMTASRYDRTRLAPPVARDAIDVPVAIKQCEADLVRFPNDPRINFQLGRLYGYAGDKEKTLASREAAAAVGNHNVIFLLGYLDWVAAKDDAARCTAASEMKLAADRGNYSAQITYAVYFNEGRFKSCEGQASKAEVAAYVAAAKPAVDGFFETRLMEHLAWELGDKK